MSTRVQKAPGCFLMNQPQLVADCVKAMRDAVSVAVTVKHRVGIDPNDRYGFVRDVPGTVADATCETFIMRARNANSQAWRSRKTAKSCRCAMRRRRNLSANSRLSKHSSSNAASRPALRLEHVGGVLRGREAYHNPWAD